MKRITNNTNDNCWLKDVCKQRRGSNSGRGSVENPITRGPWRQPNNIGAPGVRGDFGWDPKVSETLDERPEVPRGSAEDPELRGAHSKMPLARWRLLPVCPGTCRHTHTHARTRACNNRYTHTHICRHTRMQSRHAPTHARAHTHADTRPHTLKHKQEHTDRHTTHIHAQMPSTHMQTRARSDT